MRSLSKAFWTVAFGACVASSANANVIQVEFGYPGSSYGQYQTGSGGEFTLSPVQGQLDVSGYSANALTQTRNIGGVNGSFQTFCIEESEYCYPNGVVDVSKSSSADHGGVLGSRDTLSQGTGWLYSQFASGTLGGYNYTGDRHASASQLQNAIWMLEGEIATVDYGNPYVQLVTSASAFGSWSTAIADAQPSDFGVWALNLTTDGSSRQDQLYYDGTKESLGTTPTTNVPDGGMTLAMLGFAVAGLARLRRRVRMA